MSDLWKLAGYEMMQAILRFCDSMLGLNESTPENNLTDYKFIHFAAHAETISAVLEALVIDRYIPASPGSALLFEFFYLNNGEFDIPAVRLFYYDSTN